MGEVGGFVFFRRRPLHSSPPARPSRRGYAIWYTALPSLAATNAAIVQLCVPVLVALGGIVFLGESMTLRFVLASIATLGGIALVILGRRSRV